MDQSDNNHGLTKEKTEAAFRKSAKEALAIGAAVMVVDLALHYFLSEPISVEHLLNSGTNIALLWVSLFTPIEMIKTYADPKGPNKQGPQPQ